MRYYKLKFSSVHSFISIKAALRDLNDIMNGLFTEQFMCFKVQKLNGKALRQVAFE